MPKPKIFITRPDLPKRILQILENKCEVDVWPHLRDIKRDEFIEYAKGKDGLFLTPLSTWQFYLDSDLLDELGSQLKAISTMSVGYEHLDLVELKKRGILVGYTPGITAGATAELTVALTLATSRRLFEAQQQVVNWERIEWSYYYLCGTGLIGATVGIVGLGRIGQAVAKRLLNFEVAKIIYTGNKPKPEASELSAEFVTMDQLLKDSDIVIITCSLNEKTKGMFNAKAFEAMKRTAILINTSRGGVVDTSALAHALKTGQIAAAGLDVVTPEPLPADHELTKLKNCVVLPHVGDATIQARNDTALMAAHNIINALEGKPLLGHLC